jgi:hypothetical protein
MKTIEMMIKERNIRYYDMIKRYNYTPEIILEDTLSSEILDIELLSELAALHKDNKMLEKIREAVTLSYTYSSQSKRKLTA